MMGPLPRADQLLWRLLDVELDIRYLERAMKVDGARVRPIYQLITRLRDHHESLELALFRMKLDV